MKNLHINKKVIAFVLAGSITLANGVGYYKYKTKPQSDKTPTYISNLLSYVPFERLQEVLKDFNNRLFIKKDNIILDVTEENTIPSKSETIPTTEEIIETTVPVTTIVTEPVLETTVPKTTEATVPETNETTVPETTEDVTEPPIEFETQPLEGRITANVNVNIRTSPQVEGTRVGSFKAGTSKDVIGITNNNWYVFIEDGKECYAFADYIKYYPKVEVTEHQETLFTTSNLNFRDNPTTASNIIEKIPFNTEIKEYAQVDEDWYKIIYNEQVGYVNSGYLRIDKNNIKFMVEAKEELELKSEPLNEAETIYTLDKHETAKVIEDNEGWYKVECYGTTGYIRKAPTEKITGSFVIIDVSEQKLTLYSDNEIIIETDVVTGTANKDDTPPGRYTVLNKDLKATLMNDTKVDYWIRFYGGYGIHDAKWRSRFGGNIYKTAGSHGCVNTPYKAVEIVWNEVEPKKTLVFVQK